MRYTHQGLAPRPSVPALAVSSARLGEAPKSTTTSYLTPGHRAVAGTPAEVTLKVVVLQVQQRGVRTAGVVTVNAGLTMFGLQEMQLSKVLLRHHQQEVSNGYSSMGLSR